MKPSKRKIIILFIFVIFILIETMSLAVYQTAVLEETNQKHTIQKMQEQLEGNLTQGEQETFHLINEYRTQNGLEGLKVSSKLQKIAKIKAEDIVNNQYFSHRSPNLGTPFEMLKQNGVTYKIAGENLAGNISPEKAVEAWIHSPSHKENIVEEKFQYTGICVIESPIYGKVFVQLFMGME